MPRWVLPSVILLLLILAFAFRWEEGPRKTFKYITTICLHDRWTNQNWVKTYRFGIDSISITEKPAQIPYSPPDKPDKPEKPGEVKGFAVFSPPPPKAKPQNYEVELNKYNKKLEEYKIKQEKYQKQVSNYISKQFMIKKLLTILWCFFTLLISIWLYLSVKKTLTEKNNQFKGDSYVRSH